MTDGKQIQDEPIEVLVEDGNVAMTGPDGSVVVLSPEAAEETSDRLWKWAMLARQQQRRTEAADQSEEETAPAFIRWDDDPD
jgi:hypothetical protein